MTSPQLLSALPPQIDTDDDPDNDTAEALEYARYFIRHGIPVFSARRAMRDGQWDAAGGNGGCGYWLPNGWQRTTGNEAVIDQYRPGDALCAVMGHGLDLIDCDPRNGGDESKAAMIAEAIFPIVYGSTATPSGGTHDFCKSLGVPSRDGVRPGIDVKAGTDGQGHGFAFIPPTAKVSKETGEIIRYRWTARPNLDGLDDA